MSEDILSALINGVLVPFMGIFLIPRALREKDTGRYIGFTDVRLICYGILIAGLQALLVFPRYGFSIEMLTRLLFVTAFPFFVSIVLVKVSDKFNLDISYQIRRSGQSI